MPLECLTPLRYPGRWSLCLCCLVGCAGEPARGPVSLPNSGGPVVQVESFPVRRVVTETPAESLVLDPTPPTVPARLLFLAGRPTHLEPAGGVLASAGGSVLRIDADLRVQPIAVEGGWRDITTVAPAQDGYWMATGHGEILRTTDAGTVTAGNASPFEFPAVSSDPGGRAWLVRSPEQISLTPPALNSYPLLIGLEADGTQSVEVGAGVIARDPLLSNLANAGYVVAGDTALYYAPHLRDEVIALSIPEGDTLWVATRGRAGVRSEPRFDTAAPRTVRYAPAHLGMTVGPDERLYALTANGANTRLHVLDPNTGVVIRSTTVRDREATLAADSTGRVYEIDVGRLLGGVPARARPVLRPFDLPLLSGGRMTSDEIRGRVTLINVWASWCLPCRVEMPALDRLARSIEHPDFTFLTMNEDVRRADAVRFLGQFDFTFPVLMGSGTLKAHYFYVGLPMTLLVDREGRIAGRWIGFAGERQVRMIEAMVREEVKQ